MKSESVTTLGTYPTRVVRLHVDGYALPEGVSLWCKRDNETSPLYGGNKVRKLEHVLEEARHRGVGRIVTIGAVGSHHVLATTLYGRRAGFEVEGILTP